MKLAITPRTSEKKREAKRLRVNKKIPACLYNRGEKSSAIAIDKLEFDALLRSIPKGQLSTVVFALNDGQGQEFNAVIKEIQYNKTSYEVEHLDFAKVEGKERITVNVPVVLANVVDCAGVKMGGQIRLLIRQIKVNCPGDKIPTSFVIDVKDMNVEQMKKIADLNLDKDLRPIISPNEVILMIAKK
jgi:large subunit ribosomal protein L25